MHVEYYKLQYSTVFVFDYDEPCFKTVSKNPSVSFQCILWVLLTHIESGNPVSAIPMNHALSLNAL